MPPIPGAELRRFYLLPGQQYGPAAGNLPFGVVLLRRGDTQRNQALCRSFVQSIRSGAEATEAGMSVIATYWLLANSVSSSGETDCSQLLQNYDYDRAGRIMSSYGHSGGGPALLALQLNSGTGEQPSVYVLDMSRSSNNEVGSITGDWYNRISSGTPQERQRPNFLQRTFNTVAGIFGGLRDAACRLIGGGGAASQAIRFVDNELGISGTILRLVQGNVVVAVGSHLVRGICGNSSAEGGSASTPQPLPPTTTTGSAPPLTRNGSLAAGDTVHAEDGSYLDEYILTLTAGQPVIIEMSSSDFDSYLEVRQGTQRLISDDDSGGGLNARLRFVPPITGRYNIIANSARAGETGAYRLTVRAE